jgi:hypothetical protein
VSPEVALNRNHEITGINLQDIGLLEDPFNHFRAQPERILTFIQGNCQKVFQAAFVCQLQGLIQKSRMLSSERTISQTANRGRHTSALCSIPESLFQA